MMMMIIIIIIIIIRKKEDDGIIQDLIGINCIRIVEETANHESVHVFKHKFAK